MNQITKARFCCSKLAFRFIFTPPPVIGKLGYQVFDRCCFIFIYNYSPWIVSSHYLSRPIGLSPRPPQLPCGHEYCKSCVEELRQKGVDKSCPLCRNPLPPGPDKLFNLGHGMFMKIRGAIHRSRPGVDQRTPWPGLSGQQRCEMDQAVIMLKEAADQGHVTAQGQAV